MITLENITLDGTGLNREMPLLDRFSVTLPPGIVHIEADQVSRKRFINLLAGRLLPKEGIIKASGRVSWPLGEVGPFWSKMTGYETIDFLCAAFNLGERSTICFFARMMDEPAWLGRAVDTWPPAVLMQFLHISFIAPQFDIYLVQLMPMLSHPKFFAQWKPLFIERTAGKTVVMGTGHPAALRAFPGTVLRLHAGKLRAERVPTNPPQYSAAR